MRRFAYMAEVRARGGSLTSTGSGDTPEVVESTYRLWTDGGRTRVEREPTHEARPELLVRWEEVEHLEFIDA